MKRSPKKDLDIYSIPIEYAISEQIKELNRMRVELESLFPELKEERELREKNIRLKYGIKG